MRSNFRISILTIIIFFSAFRLQAQPSATQKKQFLDIMLAFPSGFNSLKNGEPKYNIKGSSFYSKVNIEGTEYCMLEKNGPAGKLDYIGMILSDEDKDYSEFEKAFVAWKKKIAGLDFNGSKLAPYVTDKYKDDDMYPETAAWRLDNSKNNIDSKYRNFTIWLQLLDLDQGGFMVRLLLTDH